MWGGWLKNPDHPRKPEMNGKAARASTSRVSKSAPARVGCGNAGGRFGEGPGAVVSTRRIRPRGETGQSGGYFALGNVTTNMPCFFSTFMFSLWTGPGRVTSWE